MNCHGNPNGVIDNVCQTDIRLNYRCRVHKVLLFTLCFAMETLMVCLIYVWITKYSVQPTIIIIFVDPGSVHHESYTLEGGSNLTLPCKEADLEERSLHTILWFCRYTIINTPTPHILSFLSPWYSSPKLIKKCQQSQEKTQSQNKQYGHFCWIMVWLSDLVTLILTTPAYRKISNKNKIKMRALCFMAPFLIQRLKNKKKKSSWGNENFPKFLKINLIKNK